MTSRFLDTFHSGRRWTANRSSGPLPSPVRPGDALETLRYELNIPADARRRHILQRLRSWLAASPDEAGALVSAFAAARRTLDASEVRLLDESEESAVIDGLSYQEFLQLSSLVPWLRHQVVQDLPQSESPAPVPSLIAALTWAGRAAKAGT